MIRAILIDATAREVRALELPADEVAQARIIHEAVRGYFETVPLFTNGDILMVNDDDRTLPAPAPRFTLVGYRGHPIAGNGVVVGSRPPDIVNASTPIEAIRALVLWG